MKEEYARALFLHRSLRSSEADVTRFAAWFNRARPHQGLANRTPDEIHPGRVRRLHPVPTVAKLHIRYLGGDRAPPVLRLRAA